METLRWIQACCLVLSNSTHERSELCYLEMGFAACNCYKIFGKNSREKVSRLVQFITGHDHNNKHEFKVNPDPEGPGPWCDRCDVPGEYQTAEHLIEDCEQLGSLRLSLFGSEAPLISDLSVAQVWSFLMGASIPWLPADED